MAKIIIPPPLRRYTDNQREIYLEGGTLGAVIDRLFEVYPELGSINHDSNLLSVFINNEIVQSERANWDSISISQGDEITLIIPIAGG